MGSAVNLATKLLDGGFSSADQDLAARRQASDRRSRMERRLITKAIDGGCGPFAASTAPRPPE